MSPSSSLRLSPLLFDAHCHLQDRRLVHWALEGEGEEGKGGETEEERKHRRLDAVVARARSAGVAGVACCACSEGDWKAVAALADRYPEYVRPSFGLHPWYLHAQRPGWEARLEALLRSRPGAGVGESGLDRAKSSRRRQLPPLDVQLEALRAHARIARELRRPLTVHCVRAAAALHDALSALAPFSRRDPTTSSSSRGGGRAAGSSSPLLAAAPLDNTCLVFHGWQGSREEVARLSRLGDGVFFSLGARSLPPRQRAPGEEAARGSLSHIPLERLLIETDSPDGFEPRCLGEGLVPLAAGGGEEEEEEEEKEKEEEEEKEDKEEEARGLNGNTKQGLGSSISKTERKQESSQHTRRAEDAPLLNQPANLAALLPELARALGRDEREVARACWENARSVFCGGGESGGGVRE